MPKVLLEPPPPHYKPRSQTGNAWVRGLGWETKARKTRRLDGSLLTVGMNQAFLRLINAIPNMPIANRAKVAGSETGTGALMAKLKVLSPGTSNQVELD